MKKILPSQAFAFIGSVYLLALFLFADLRFLFYISYPELTASNSFSEIIKAFFIGIRFDQIIILVILSPLLLITPWIKLKSKLAKRAIISYLSILISVCIILLLADIRFYDYFQTRLNFLAVDYISEGSMAMDLTFSDPKLYLMLFLWLTLSIVTVILLRIVYNRTLRLPDRRSWVNQIIYLVLFIMLFGLGIRGRIQISPLDWGAAYYSDNPFLNQLALNGVYTLGRNLNEKGRDPRVLFTEESQRFKFVDSKESFNTSKKILSQSNKVWSDEVSLKGTIRQEPKFGYQPNIILIISESWMAELTGSLDGTRDLTPNFDRLAQDGILFTDFYANGYRTNYGLSATLCSFPTLPGRAIMKRYDAKHPFITLPEILEKRGYENSFYYGGDLVFDNMEGFFRQKSYHKFYGEDDFSLTDRFSKWGVPDHILFERLVDSIDTFKRPFQITTLTLSNHEPFDLPDSSVQRYKNDDDSSKVFNSQIYADYSIGKFFERIKQNPVFDSTIFVIVSDHCKLKRMPLPIDPRNFKIPLMIYSPALLKDSALRIDIPGSQVDVTPTIMSILGGDYEYEGWGRSLFDIEDNFTVLSRWNIIGMLTDRFYYVETLGFKSSFYLRNGDSYYQTDTSGYYYRNNWDVSGHVSSSIFSNIKYMSENNFYQQKQIDSTLPIRVDYSKDFQTIRKKSTPLCSNCRRVVSPRQILA